MGRGFKFAVIVIVIVAASLAPRSRAGQVIDGIVATVNGTAILQSDVEEAARCEALLESRAPGEIGPAQEHAVLERLIDQELLRQQMANGFPPPKAEELAQRIMDLRRQMEGAGSEEGWRVTLGRYRLSEEEVAERIAVQMQMASFVDLHLQGGLQIDRASVSQYYRQKLLPALRQRGVQSEPPLFEVSGQIEQILRQQREDELLTSWLNSLRQQSRIWVNREMAAAGQPASGHDVPAGRSK